MQRLLQGTAAALGVTLLDQNGADAPASGAVTVEVRRADGSSLLPVGSATSGTNPYARSLTPAQTADLDELTATWTDAGDGSVHTTRHEIVGGFVFRLAELRAQPNLDSLTRFPDAALIDARQWFETRAEAFCGVAFVPRFRRVVLTSRDLVSLHLPDRLVRSVRSATVDGAAVAVVPVLSGSGHVVRLTGTFKAGASVLAFYIHGFDQTPEDVKAAALVACRHKLISDHQGAPSRELSVANELGGTTRLSIPSVDRPTGLLEVDAVLASYRAAYQLPGVA